MTILILTSKSHIYANFVLSNLIKKHLFSHDRMYVFEQDAVVPQKTPLVGLQKYIMVSGLYYVLLQIMKQLLFFFRQTFDIFFEKKSSLFYPYQQLTGRVWDIHVQNDIKSNDIYERIKKLNPDLILSIYSKEIIPTRILAIPHYGAVNIHPAYLPHYRGVSPVFWALANGEQYAGVTLHYLDTGIDTGPIIFQKKISTQGYTSEHELYMQLSVLGVTLLTAFLQKLFLHHDKIPSQIKQRNKGSYYSLPTKEAVKRFVHRGNCFYRVSDFLH